MRIEVNDYIETMRFCFEKNKWVISTREGKQFEIYTYNSNCIKNEDFFITNEKLLWVESLYTDLTKLDGYGWTGWTVLVFVFEYKYIVKVFESFLKDTYGKRPEIKIC